MQSDLHQVSDKLAIQELNANYFWAVDSNDVKAYLDAWTEDGISQAAYGSVSGHQELASRFESMQQSLSKNKRHIVSNLVIELQGDKAVQKCYLVVFERQDEPTVISTAIYHDELTRTSTGWKFSKRSISIDPSWNPKH